IVLALNSITLCQWSNDPYVNTRVSYWGVSPKALADGNGGAFVSFENFSYDSTFTNLQKINYDGTIKWNTSIHIPYEGNHQSTEAIIPSDSNNIILAYGASKWYFDSLGHEIIISAPYVQKFDSDGNKLFGFSGIRLSIDTTKLSGYAYEVTSDNSGGIFCFWHTFIPLAGPYTDKIYIQHISKDGQRLWGNNGILIADSVFSVLSMKILTDDSGGIFVLYHQNQSEFYIENYDSTGTLKWRIIDGLVLEHSKWVKDGEGGIIISTAKQEYPQNKLILHRISNTGGRIWGENGIILDDSVTNIHPEAASVLLNSDSTITALWDNGWYPVDDLFIQRFDLLGNKLWNNNILVSDVISSKADIGLLESEMNSNILIWSDRRTPSGFYAQRINKFGTKVWGDSDRAITNQSPGTNAVISDGNNGAIVIWADDEPLNGILAQQISKNGNLGEVLTSINDDNYFNRNPNSFKLFQNYPNPFNPSTIINYSVKDAGLVKIKVYDILGSDVATLVNETKEAGNFAVEFNPANLPSGVYIYTLQVNGFTSSKKMLLMK
ncbi:MAG: T9SS type A sorting domain-containing protein, partial [Ignavibacteriaceae bacterium]